MYYDLVKEAADFINSKIVRKPTLGIILGSGLGSIVDIMEEKVVIPYSDIPNFPQGTVAGHKHNLVFGKIGKTEVVAMQGRFHFYEGLEMNVLTFPIYVMKMIGVENLIVTNACGAINENYKPGDLMLIKDHINLAGKNPLIGPNDERFGPRFPDMSEAYSLERIDYAKNIANKLGINPQVGVYAFYSGPSYETAAEIRAFKAMGADTCGMSTVPETIVANYLGMKVLGVACITNMATGISKTKHSHEEVLRVANKASEDLCMWVKDIIKNW